MSVEKAYDDWSFTYDRSDNKTRDLDVAVTKKVLDKIQFSNVLELGCGTGKHTSWLAENGARVTAIDISEGMLKLAREKVKLKNVRFIQKDIREEWPFPNDFFDLVTINLVLEHVENIEDIIKKASGVLGIGNYLFISEFHPFRQYLGKGARYEKEGREILVDSFVHHVSEFFQAGKSNNFELERLNEWKDENSSEALPRLISFLFKKNAN